LYSFYFVVSDGFTYALTEDEKTRSKGLMDRVIFYIFVKNK